MKPELMAEYMRKRRLAEKEANSLPEAQATSKSSKNVKGLETNLDKFQGMKPNEYYVNLCQFCGCPETKLMSRNGFSGYLCEAHSFE